METAENFVQWPCYRVFDFPAGKFLCHGIKVLDKALGVGGHYTVTNGLQRNLCAFLFTEQRLFVNLTLSNIALDPNQSSQTSVVIRQCLDPAIHPAPFAIAALHAMNAFKNISVAGQMLA